MKTHPSASSLPDKAFNPIHAVIGGKGEPPIRLNVLRVVQDAECILGRDVASGETHVFYLEKNLDPTVEHKAVGFFLDFDTDELEFLVAMCETVKGRCDYEDNGNPPDCPIRLTVEPTDDE